MIFYFIVQTIRQKWFSEDFLLQVLSQLGAGILLINLTCDFCWNCVSPGFDSARWMKEDLHSYSSVDLTVSIPVMQIPGFWCSQPSRIPNFSPIFKTRSHIVPYAESCMSQQVTIKWCFFFHGGQWCKIWRPFHMALDNFFLSSLRMMHNVWIRPTTDA